MNINETNLNWNGSLSYNNNPNKILLHNADASNCSIYDIHDWHLSNGWVGCGYHYLVRKDGSVYRGRPEECAGAHCPGQNTQSIGICSEGAYNWETMTEQQYQAVLNLMQDIRNRYGNIPAYGHKEFYSTDCPGNNFPLQKLKEGQGALDDSNVKVYIVSQYLANGYHGDGSFNGIDIKYIDQYMCGVRWYMRANSYGQWIETEMLDRDKAEEVKNSLGSWFCEFRK